MRSSTVAYTFFSIGAALAVAQVLLSRREFKRTMQDLERISQEGERISQDTGKKMAGAQTEEELERIKQDYDRKMQDLKKELTARVKK
mmetsp:Transcript_5218/g.8085  ORF Transcript_5218/g.8085 Transcript_5218/m.8085 type:complete len:88 (-) Transcript_5218:516-779(-)